MTGKVKGGTNSNIKATTPFVWSSQQVFCGYGA